MNNSGWRGLDDTRLDRLFEQPKTFREETVADSGDAFSDLSSWLCDFEGHHLRLAEVPSQGGRLFALYMDGEPVGELDILPAGWTLEGLAS